METAMNGLPRDERTAIFQIERCASFIPNLGLRNTYENLVSFAEVKKGSR